MKDVATVEEEESLGDLEGHFHPLWPQKFDRLVLKDPME